MACFSRPNTACHSVPMGILIFPKSTDEEGSGNPEQERPPPADLMQSCILLRINPLKLMPIRLGDVEAFLIPSTGARSADYIARIVASRRYY